MCVISLSSSPSKPWRNLLVLSLGACCTSTRMQHAHPLRDWPHRPGFAKFVEERNGNKSYMEVVEEIFSTLSHDAKNVSGSCWTDPPIHIPVTSNIGEGDEEASINKPLNCLHVTKLPLINYPLTEEMLSRSVIREPSNQQRNRLHTAFKKAALGESLKVVVLGGSMTMGAHCDANLGSFTYPNKDCSWGSFLRDWLIARFPNSNVQVQNNALGGCNSICQLDRLGSSGPLPFDDPVDIVIADIAVNDAFYIDPKMPSRKSEIHLATEVIMQYVLSMPSQPALIYLEGCSQIQNDKPVSRVRYELQMLYSDLALWHGVPMLSYKTAIWPVFENPPEPSVMWLEGDYGHGVSVQAHPMWITHQLFADMLVHFLDAEYLMLSAAKFSVAKDVMDESVNRFDDEMVVTNLSELRSESKEIWEAHCLPGGAESYEAIDPASTSPKGKSFLPLIPSNKTDEWELKKDVYYVVLGYIVYGADILPNTKASITFSLQCNHKEGDEHIVWITYLESYERMGKVNVLVDGTKQIEIDSLNTRERVSISVRRHISVGPGPHDITIEMDAVPEDDGPRERHKFKLMRLACC